jgi:hypothetical protein
MKSVTQQARDLASTSVDDMWSSIRCAWQHGGIRRDVLLIARDLCESTGQKTKRGILERELRRNARGGPHAAR